MTKAQSREHSIAGPLQLWDKLELVFDEKDKQGRYRTRIEDINGEYMLIDRPILLTGDALFRVGADFMAVFIKTDSAYTFNGRIIDKHGGDLDAYWITTPRQISRNQRRRFYRIDTDSPAIVGLMDNKSSPDRQDDKPCEFEATCLNISGNGLLLMTKLEVDMGSKILMTVKLKDYQRELNLLGVIRRKERDKDNRFHYGVEFFTTEEVQLLLSASAVTQLPERFLKFNENQRTHLLNHIFAQQLALKKKGLV